MAKKKKTKKPAATTDRSPPPPPPPDWYREPGTPEPVDPDKDTVVSRSLFILDEETFMRSVANRLNAFLATYPDEAQHVLSQFLHYEHELVGVHAYIREQTRAERGDPPDPNPPPPGITVAQLFAALLQTHHGNGFVLRPIIVPDPHAKVGGVRIVKFVVDRQDDQESEHTA